MCLLRYMTLMKKSIEERAKRSSCLATNGQITQFTTMGTAVPTKKDRPLATARTVMSESWVWFCRPREITAKEMQPTKPDRCVLMELGEGTNSGLILGGFLAYRMGTVNESVEHGDHVDGSKDGQDVGIPPPGGVRSSAPKST